MVPDMTPEKIQIATEEQVDFAIQVAKILIVVVNGRDGCTALDEWVVDKIRKNGKPTILVVNKVDFPELIHLKDDFHKLGFKDTIALSAEHGYNTETLRETIDQLLGPKPEEEKVDKNKRVQISFIGRPNVGKSSLCNRLLKEKRLIVSDVPGTTRETVELDLDYKVDKDREWFFRLHDTAGLRKKKRVDNSLEYFSSLRTENAIEKSDVVFLVIDAILGIQKQEKDLAGKIVDAGKAIVLVVNKWDLALKTFKEDPIDGYANEAEFRKAYTASILHELFFMSHAPVIFTSAISGYSIDRMLKKAKAINRIQDTQFPTPAVNNLVYKLLKKQSPHLPSGSPFKVYYAIHVSVRPFRIRLFCNREIALPQAFQRYLEKGFVKEFELSGCPIKFHLTGKKPKGTDKKKKK